MSSEIKQLANIQDGAKVRIWHIHKGIGEREMQLAKVSEAELTFRCVACREEIVLRREKK